MPFFYQMFANVALRSLRVTWLLNVEVKCGDHNVRTALGGCVKTIVGHLLKAKPYPAQLHISWKVNRQKSIGRIYLLNPI